MSKSDRNKSPKEEKTQNRNTLYASTILAKMMWDKLAECTASTIDQFFTWKQTFFGPNPTSSPPPPPPPPLPQCNVIRKEGFPTSRPTLHRGGRGKRANIAAIRENGTLSHTFLARIVANVKGLYARIKLLRETFMVNYYSRFL